MLRTATIATLFAAMPFAAEAQAGGKWEVNIAPAECSLIRNIQGEAPAMLALQTVPGTDSVTMLVSGKDVPRRSTGSTLPVELTFDDAGALHANAFPAGTLATGPALRLLALEPSMLDRFAGARKASLGTGSHSFASFEIPGARAAVAALRKCVSDQLVDWGADPAQFTAGGSPAVALKDRDHWLSNAQLLKIAGTTNRRDIYDLYRVTIAVDGTIDGCRREGGEANAGAEKLGCDPLIGQKLFAPARNPAGLAVRGAASFLVMLTRRPY